MEQVVHRVLMVRSLEVVVRVVKVVHRELLAVMGLPVRVELQEFPEHLDWMELYLEAVELRELLVVMVLRVHLVQVELQEFPEHLV